VWLCSQYKASLFVFGTSLRSLGLNSLTHVPNGKVLITRNEHLCFADTINWRRITNDRSDAIVVRDNSASCGKFVFFAVSDAIALFWSLKVKSA